MFLSIGGMTVMATPAGGGSVKRHAMGHPPSFTARYTGFPRPLTCHAVHLPAVPYLAPYLSLPYTYPGSLLVGGLDTDSDSEFEICPNVDFFPTA